MIDEPLARFTAEADQAKEGTRDLARVLTTFREELVDGGFESQQAFDLSRELLLTMLENPVDEDYE